MSTLVLSITIILNAGIIKDDFLVNPDSPNKCTKGNALAAPSPSGWFVAWNDTRNVANRNDIYGQALSESLIPIGENKMLPYDSFNFGGVIGVASDSSGNTVVLWIKGTIQKEIWLRRISPTGEPYGNDTLLLILNWLGNAQLAMNSEGEYAIVWKDAGFIGLAMFNPDGSLKAETQQVVDDSTNLTPRVSIAENGAVIVTWAGDWTDLKPESGKLYARCYRRDGTPRGDVFEVASYENNSSFPPVIGDRVAVGCDHAGKFILSWVVEDIYSTVRDVLCFRPYAWDGTPLGVAVKIYNMPPSEEGDYIIGPYMVVGWDGSFSVAWGDTRSGHYRTYLQNFFDDGSQRGPEMTISEDRPEDCRISSLALKADQWFAVYSAGNDIYCRRGMVQGSIIGDEVLINDDSSSCSETVPQVLADDSSNFVVLWQRGGVYGQRFSREGVALTDTFKCTKYGRASMNRRNGEFVLTDRSDPWGEQKIWAQRYNKNGIAQGEELKVTDIRAYPNVSMNRKGAFAVAWPGIDNKVCVKRYDKNNQPLDAEPILVGSSDTKLVGTTPGIVFKDDGSFIVAWKDRRGAIYAERCNSSGKPLGEEFMVSPRDSLGNEPILALDDKGNFCVAWRNEGPLWETFVRIYDADGNALTDTMNTGIFDTTQMFTRTIEGISVAALPDEGFVFYGTEIVNTITGNTDVSAIYYHSDGTSWSRKTQVNDPDQFCFHYQIANYNSVAAGGDRIVYVWQDNRRHKGWDIYAKIMDLDIPGIEEHSPSPVTPVTHQIDLESGIGSAVTLRYSDFPEGLRASVYDASGRRVDNIESSPHSGTITWGKGYGTGVYFIVPQGVQAKAKRVVLVK